MRSSLRALLVRTPVRALLLDGVVPARHTQPLLPIDGERPSALAASARGFGGTAAGLRQAPHVSELGALTRHVRGFAKGGGRRRGGRNVAAAQPELPLLKDTLRKLQVMVHPDKFGQHPHASDANTQSLAALQGFLSSIKSLEGSYPAASMQPLHFYIRNDNGDLKQLKTTLRTTGGDCRKLVEAQIGQLFTAVGLPAAFRWQEGFWEMKDAPPEPEAAREHKNDTEYSRGTEAPDYNFHNPYPKKKKEEAVSEAMRSAKPAGATDDFELPAGIQRQYVDEATLNEQKTVPVRTEDADANDGMPQIFLNNGDNKDLDSELDAMDPLLEAVACIPWIEDDDERDEIIRVTLMDHLEMTGWKIRGAVERIWSGERNEVSLVAGADVNSAAMISRVLTHAHHIEVTFGPVKRVEFPPLKAYLEEQT